MQQISACFYSCAWLTRSLPLQRLGLSSEMQKDNVIKLWAEGLRFHHYLKLCFQVTNIQKTKIWDDKRCVASKRNLWVNEGIISLLPTWIIFLFNSRRKEMSNIRVIQWAIRCFPKQVIWHMGRKIQKKKRRGRAGGSNNPSRVNFGRLSSRMKFFFFPFTENCI